LPIYCRMPSLTCNRKSNRFCLYYHLVLTWDRVQIKNFVEGLFTLNNAYDRFKLNLRDFLIQLKEFAGDNAELFAEEKEQMERDAKAAERERLSKVGGLLKPAELAEDDDEL
jgi:exportin-1